MKQNQGRSFIEPSRDKPRVYDFLEELTTLEEFETKIYDPIVFLGEKKFVEVPNSLMEVPFEEEYFLFPIIFPD